MALTTLKQMLTTAHTEEEEDYVSAIKSVHVRSDFYGRRAVQS